MNEVTPASTASSVLRATVLSFAPAVLFSLLFFAGCKSNQPVAPQDDAALTQAVQGKLASDSSLGGEPVQATVQQGVATLNGTVSTDAARSLAASDAAQITGIRTVVNNLVVQPSTAVASVTPHLPALRADHPTHRPRPAAKPSAEVVAPPAPPPAQPPAAPITEQAAAPVEREAPAAKTPPPPPANRSITLASGTTIPIRITQTLDSASTQQGDTFSGVLASDILSDNNVVVLPQGTPVSGRVVTVQEAAHFKGNSLLTIELTSLDRKGDHLPITTDSFSKAGKGRGKNTAEKIGGGAAVGAILGGILGGGRGAAIGAAAGGGAGTGVQAVTKGQQVQIESESLVRFHLSNPVTVRLSASDQAPAHHDDPDLGRHQ